MNLVTLQRRAPVAPSPAECRLCDAHIAGTFQDHLLVGPPGVGRYQATICQRCGESVRRLAELYGPELSVVVQDHSPAVDTLIGGPAARTDMARTPPRAEAAVPAPPDPQLERTRQHLTEEAESLARTERTLRAEADRLGSVRPPAAPS